MMNNSGSRLSPKTAGAPLGYGFFRGLVNAWKALGVRMGAAFIVLLGLAAPVWANDDPVTILALGDSLTAGYGLEQGQGFTGQLQGAIDRAGLNAKVINAGVSGDTSAGGRSRLDWLLSPDVDAVIVELGANDGLRGLDPAETRQNLDWILGRLKDQGLAVLLTGMVAPPNLGSDYGREFNSIYPDLAEKYGAVFDPFFLEGVAAVPDLNQDDGIHPTAEGVAVIVERMLPKVRTLIERARAPSN